MKKIKKMNSTNIQLVILIIFIKYIKCNEIDIIKKEINNLKEDFKYLGQSMSRQITELKEVKKEGSII
jgi:hypothetical protein